MVDQLLDRLGARHESTRHPLIPQAVGMPDAVRAVQRAPLDVVQAEPALAVLDHLTGTLRKPIDLLPGEQGNMIRHRAYPLKSPGRWRRFAVHSRRLGPSVPSEQKISQHFSNHHSRVKMGKSAAILRNLGGKIIHHSVDDRPCTPAIAGHGCQLLKGTHVQLDLLRLAEVKLGGEGLD